MLTRATQGCVRIGRRGRDLVRRLAGFHILSAKLDRLEALSHGARATYLGNDRVLVRIVVEDANIAYIVEAQDKLLTPWFVATGTYETGVTQYLVRHLQRDSYCLDVGANFGYFTCLMARFCPDGRTIGLEADRKIFELLRDNILINGFGEFTHAWHAAASETQGRITLFRRHGRSGNTSIAPAEEAMTTAFGEPAATPFEVECVRIDDVVANLGGRVDFIKVDVEGAEPLVLRGATQAIRNNPNLKILMEWSPGQIVQAGFEIKPFLHELEHLGLSAFDILGPFEEQISFETLQGLSYRAAVVLRRP